MGIKRLVGLGLVVMASSVGFAELPLYIAVPLVGGGGIERYASAEAVPGGVQDVRYKTDVLLMRLIPAGRNPVEVKPGERGDFRITKPFYCGVYEVTQQQWEHCCGDLLAMSRPSRFSNPKWWRMRPVESVSWTTIRGSASWPESGHNVDKFSFLGLLRMKTGNKIAFDIPTEAQWEYACRAGTSTTWNNGAMRSNREGGGDAELDKLGRYCQNGGEVFVDGKPTGAEADCGIEHGTAIVGSYAPNAWGLYDMHGNVGEWCLDWNENNAHPCKILCGDDPVGPAGGERAVIRGGGWWNAMFGGPNECKSSARGLSGWIAKGTPHSAVGVRVVAEIPEELKK